MALARDLLDELRPQFHLVREATEAFGLLERDGDGWSLCIPDGAEAEARVDERPLDLRTLFLDPSGERRLPLRAGLEARVLMGGFRFELRPDAAA